MTFRAIAILADVMVLVVTWLKTYDVWKASRELKHFRPTLSVLLLRDGTFYFLALFVVNSITLVLDVLAHFGWGRDGGTDFIYITDTVGPVCIARFILDLRSVSAKNNPTHTPALSDISTVRFMSTPAPFVNDFAGQLGPQTTWVTGALEDADVGAEAGARRVEEKVELDEVAVVSTPASGAFELESVGTERGSRVREV
ncbi:hypothetical protein EIP91_004765 [Steccherinum ochraceum]|uniref:Uncharacterized protein n=1 Tax=Steccherinum ochraceum TaxID=92696 RepID=A0A4R0RJF8_9APHY|nr:hypothetical protein EIP91_004765 [Steccherinum ochraceum]